MTFHDNRLLADDPHEITYLIFSKIRKDVAKNLSSVAVVVVTLSANHAHYIVPVLQQEMVYFCD